MHKLAIVPLALFCIGAAAPRDAPRPAAPHEAEAKGSRGEARPGEILLRTPAHCLDAGPRRADGDPLRGRRLDQLPPGNLSLTVMREVNGCPQPAIVRQGYGAPGLRR